jgi:hypothetical protein
MVFPMRKDKKVSRVQEEVVSVVEWRGPDGVRNWLFVKRPEIGMFRSCKGTGYADSKPQQVCSLDCLSH